MNGRRPADGGDSIAARRAIVFSWALAVPLLLAACDRFSSAKTAFDGESAMEYVRTQLEFGPRVPGTPGHQRAAEWIEEQMRARADTVIVQSWTHVTATGDTIPLRNIFARFRPEAAERILYVTHWDTRPRSEAAADPSRRTLPVPGANDGASGTAMLIALADVLKKTPPTMGVDLLFVDGEDYGEFPATDVLLGSKYFAANLPGTDYMPIFGVVWDMIGDLNLGILQEGNSLQRAPEVVSRVWRTAAELGYEKFFLPRAGGPITDDHVPLLDAGLRVIDVIDIDYPAHHTPEDTIDKISSRSLQIVGDVATALILGD